MCSFTLCKSDIGPHHHVLCSLTWNKNHKTKGGSTRAAFLINKRSTDDTS